MRMLKLRGVLIWESRSRVVSPRSDTIPGPFQRDEVNWARRPFSYAALLDPSAHRWLSPYRDVQCLACRGYCWSPSHPEAQLLEVEHVRSLLYHTSGSCPRL